MAKATKKKETVQEEQVESINQAERLKNLQNAMSNINKKFGKTVIGKASEPEIANKLLIKCIPTPSLKLNEALGGGWPRGKFCISTGNPDSGKTDLQLNTIAKNQKEDPNFIAAWIESENSINDKLLDMFEIDRERFIFYNVGTEGGEKAMDIILNIAQNDVDMIVINSLKHLTPSKELRDNMEDQNVALQARLNANFVRKITSILSEKSNTAVVAIQHKSTEIGSYMPSKKIVGGDAIMYAAYVITDNSKVNINSTNPLYNMKDKYKQFKVKVLKNHMRVDVDPYVQLEYTVRIGKGIDTIREIIDEAEQQEIIVKRGAWIREYDEDGSERILPDGTKCAWNGSAKFLEFVEANPDYVEYLKNKIEGNITVEKLSQEEIDALKEQEAAYAESAGEIEKLLDEEIDELVTEKTDK